MLGSSQSTRLGDLLIDKGKVSQEQLFVAIRIQQQRREIAEQTGASLNATNTELGEILIELGYISRDQLISCLSWQKRLRKTTLAMTFVAPLLTAACGGGSGEASAPKVQTTQTTVSSLQNNFSSATANSSKMALSSSVVSLGNSSKNSVSSASINSNKIVVSSSSSSLLTSTPKSSSSIAKSSQGSSFSASSTSSRVALSSSAKSSSVTSSKASSKSSSASASVSAINGPVLLNWTPPTHRENGDYLDIAEVGGYQLRYKLKSQSQYTSILIENGYTDSYYFNNMKGDYVFEIAAFDKNGLYSDFVEVNSL